MPDRERYQLCQSLSKKQDLWVDLVEDQMTGKRYVQKTLDRLQCSPLLYHQFKVEIDILSQIQSPYIPQLMDVWEDDRFIVLMETWLEGEDLRSWIQTHQRQWRRCRKNFILELMDLLEKLPQSMDTVIGTKGVYLSGGEQQRIAIARAVLKNTPVLILDEATAFADPDNEVRVQQALSALSKGKTVVMIAHRLSSITRTDCIYVLQDGEIIESGTHRRLIDQNGVFAHMWNNYSESVEWKIAKEAKR